MINMEQLQKELKVQMADQVQSYLALLLVVLVVGMFLAVTITKSITEPLQQLQRTAEQLGRGNLNARARTGGLEEINVLARAFNQMSDRIRRLLDKTRQEQKNLRELELRLHQEQISPHFLYNTLDSIVWMAEGGNNRQVVEMTTDLSDFFRTVLSGGRDFITIEEEESHIRSYLKIQKIRYEDILDYSIEIEPSIRHRIVLKMLLQPLVENAILHGAGEDEYPLHVKVSATAEDGKLVISVSDNGAGIPEEVLKKLRDHLSGGGLGGGFTLLGDGAVLLAALANGFSISLFKRYAEGEDTLTLCGYQFIVGGGLLLLTGLCFGGTLPHFTGQSLLLLGYMVLLSAVAQTIWSALTRYNPVGRVAVYGFLNPVFGVLLSALLLREGQQAFTPYSLAALVLVCVGIFVVNRSDAPGRGAQADQHHNRKRDGPYGPSLLLWERLLYSFTHIWIFSFRNSWCSSSPLPKISSDTSRGR